MENYSLFEFENSLNQKFNAVCFDIDGTLTIKNSKNIDNSVIKVIANLLERKIPIIFITGRGECGLNDFIVDVFPKLLNDYKIKKK